MTGYPHRMVCPHCGYTIPGRFAWLVRRKMRKHRENVHHQP